MKQIKITSLMFTKTKHVQLTQIKLHSNHVFHSSFQKLPHPSLPYKDYCLYMSNISCRHPLSQAVEETQHYRFQILQQVINSTTVLFVAILASDIRHLTTIRHLTATSRYTTGIIQIYAQISEMSFQCGCNF